MRKPSTFFLQASKLEIGQLAIVGESPIPFIFTEEHQSDANYAEATGVAPIVGLRYCMLHVDDEVYNPMNKMLGKVKNIISPSEVEVVYENESTETSIRKDLYKVLAKKLTEKQLRPVLKGSLRNFNKIVVEFPSIKVIKNDNFTADVEIDGMKMETVKLTGDEVADKLAIATTCDKYAEPVLDENDNILIDKYKKTK